ncbi:MAG: sugar transferase [Myxococcales bacterium]
MGTVTLLPSAWIRTGGSVDRPGRAAVAFSYASDLIAVVGSIIAPLVAAGRFRSPGVHLHDLVWICVGACAVWLLGAAVLRSYDAAGPARGRAEEAVRVSLLAAAVVCWVSILRWVAPHVGAVPETLAVVLTLWPASLAIRFALVRPVLRNVGIADQVLIVGAGRFAEATAQVLEKRGRHPVQGHLSLPHDAASRSLRAVGSSTDLERILRHDSIAEVYVAPDSRLDADAAQEAVRICEQLGVPFALPAWTLRLERGVPSPSHHLDDGYIHFRCIDPVVERQMELKHVFDLLAATAALGVLAPLFLIVAALVRLDSSGPAFFRQPRVGTRGRMFGMLKFRSMVCDAEKQRAALASQNECKGPVFKIANDPRITRMGRFIRKYSIDELPQLINVARGEMSLVGPRPPLRSEVEQYEPWQLRRLSLRPGLTCLWQVAGRSRVGFHEWMLLDLRYIDTWSIGADLALIARTVPAVLTGRGAS